MTKKERKAIYLKAAETIGKIPNYKYWGCCPTISYVILGYNNYEMVTEEEFPEFYLLRPEEEINIHRSWWIAKEVAIMDNVKFCHSTNVKERQTVLLLAAELCN